MKYVLKSSLQFAPSGNSQLNETNERPSNVGIKRSQVVGILYNLLKQLNKERVEKIHDDNSPKPFSIYIFSPEKKNENEIEIELNLIDVELIENLLGSLQNDNALNFELNGCKFTYQKLNSVEIQSPKDIIKKAKDSLGLIQIKYFSPVALSDNPRLTRLKKIFKNLRQNWNFYFPDCGFEMDIYEDPPYEIRETEIKYFPVDIGYSKVKGFIGKDLLEIKDWKYITLLLLAEYTYIGKKTNFGLGRCKIQSV